MANENYIGVKLPKNEGGLLRERLQVAANKHEVALSRFLLDSAIESMEIGAQFKASVEKHFESLGWPWWKVVKAVVIKRMAEDDAQAEICGQREDICVEFMEVDEDCLYKTIKTNELKKLEREVVEHALEKEYYGLNLEEFERELLIKYRVGKAWAESDERKKELEMQKYVEEIEAKMRESIKNNPEEKEKYERFKEKYGVKDGKFTASYWENDEPEK